MYFLPKANTATVIGVRSTNKTRRSLQIVSTRRELRKSVNSGFLYQAVCLASSSSRNARQKVGVGPYNHEGDTKSDSASTKTSRIDSG